MTDPQRRPLGTSGLSIAPLMLGGNVFGWSADAPTSFAILDRFVDAGFNAIDTADVYSRWIPGHVGGESETVLGKWLAQGGGRREKVMLATKVGMDMGEGRKGLSRDYIVRAVEASLTRLHTDRIDLYQSHQPDDAVPHEETLRAYDELIQAGKVRAIGASNYSAEQLDAALDESKAASLPRYATLQPWFNLYDRDQFEGPLEDLCLARGVGAIPYFGLASGFLTGKYRDIAQTEGTNRGYRVKNYFTPKGMRILAALDRVAAELGGKPGQVALAWLMARPSIVAPIASATSVAQLDELMGAARLTLSEEQVTRLNRAGDE